MGPAALVLDAVAKCTIVLLAGAGIAALARRRSAAWRHAIWCATLFGAAAIPLLALALPRWHSGWIDVEPAPARASARDEATSPVESVAWAPASAEKTPATPLLAADGAGFPVAPLALLAWIGGALVALSRAARALARTTALVREASPIRGGRALEALALAARDLGVRRVVRLAESERAGTALASGVLSPVVILPASHREWPDAQLRIALLHELAHVKRADVAIHLAARVATAILFFHPLARLAARRIDVLREHACDDAVLAAGTRSTDYAEALLAAARDVRAPRLALAMARPFPIEERIASLLDATRERRPPARAAIARLAAALLTAVAILASLDARSDAAPQLPSAARGPAVQTRWTDGRWHVGAFARGGVRFAPDGASIDSMDPGAFLLVAVRDAAAGRVGTVLFVGGEDGRPRRVAGSAAALDPVLPETARRLRAGLEALPPGDGRVSGSTLVGDTALTTDGEGRVVLARFETERGPAGVFASGPISLSADGRAIEAMGDGAFLVLVSEDELPIVVEVVPRAGGGPPERGDAEREAILASTLPSAWRATADAARAVWREN